MHSNLTIRRQDQRVLLIDNVDGVTYDFEYRQALYLAALLKMATKHRGEGWQREVLGRITVLRSEEEVFLLRDGAVVLVMPPEAAITVANAIRQKAHDIQEDLHAEQVIADQALLSRHGMPFGITHDKRKLDAAFKEAQWLPRPGHDRVSKVGTPTLEPQPPKQEPSHA